MWFFTDCKSFMHFTWFSSHISSLRIFCTGYPDPFTYWTRAQSIQDAVLFNWILKLSVKTWYFHFVNFVTSKHVYSKRFVVCVVMVDASCEYVSMILRTDEANTVTHLYWIGSNVQNHFIGANNSHTISWKWSNIIWHMSTPYWCTRWTHILTS